jgi:hypothetical protein
MWHGSSDTTVDFETCKCTSNRYVLLGCGCHASQGEMQLPKTARLVLPVDNIS